jgi:hypothetical protein
VALGTLTIVGINVNSPNLEITVASERATLILRIPEVQMAGKSVQDQANRILAEVRDLMAPEKAPLPGEYQRLIGLSGKL